MDNIREQEIILKAEYWLDDLEESIREQIKNDPKMLFETQEKKIAIFLYARGYKIRGIRKKSIKVAGNQSKKILVFCFDNVVKRAILEYYNNNNPGSYNINAKSILDAQQDITSMIVNF